MLLVSDIDPERGKVYTPPGRLSSVGSQHSIGPVITEMSGDTATLQGYYRWKGDRKPTYMKVRGEKEEEKVVDVVSSEENVNSR